MILGMRSLRQSQRLYGREYQSVRAYLLHGPPIQISYDESRDYQWNQYEKAVKDILGHPDAASWLDSPLDPSMTEGSRENAITRSWKAKDRAKFDGLKLAVYILFWITHITAALAYVILVNESEPSSISTLRS